MNIHVKVLVDFQVLFYQGVLKLVVFENFVQAFEDDFDDSTQCRKMSSHLFENEVNLLQVHNLLQDLYC